ncbi:MAG: AAA family ATPase [Propionibacteriaceae bacterium]|jgi:hypothetical protein|nr:AAA family ATPase [Propionibacteriaceae bacterium]
MIGESGKQVTTRTAGIASADHSLTVSTAITRTDQTDPIDPLADPLDVAVDNAHQLAELSVDERRATVVDQAALAAQAALVLAVPSPDQASGRLGSSQAADKPTAASVNPAFAHQTGIPDVSLIDGDLSRSRRWCDLICQLEPGDASLDLWSSETSLKPTPTSIPPEYRSEQPLNPGQQRALAAMTSAGGHLIWAPPGTGKTAVIAAAIQDAIATGRTVLLTALTNRAVDNAIGCLLGIDRHFDLGLITPGVLVRAVSDKTTSHDRLAPEVADHPFLLTDRAAAVMTGLTQRQAELDRAVKANQQHADRSAARSLLAQIKRRDRQARGARLLNQQKTLVDQCHALTAQITALQAESASLPDQRTAIEQELTAFAELAQQQLRHNTAVSAASQSLMAWQELLDSHSAGLDAAVAEQTDLAQRQERLAKRSILPWLARRRAQHSADIAAQRQSLAASIEAAQAPISEATGQVDQWRRRLEELASDEVMLSARQSLADQCRQRLLGLDQRQSAIDQEISQLENRFAQLAGQLAITTDDSSVITDPSTTPTPDQPGTAPTDMVMAQAQLADWQRCYQAAERSGDIDLLHHSDAAVARVTQLDAELLEIARRQTELEDDYRRTRRQLLTDDGAPVIACTIEALLDSPELLARRFDLVIVDEAAHAPALKVLYAAAKADFSCSLVGDFLQNPPFSAPADPGQTTNAPTNTSTVAADTAPTSLTAPTGHDPLIWAWLTQDIFALAGITDAASAARHRHCHALSLQYRYPPIIAETVNRFCYDGLLESAQQTPAHPVIFFHDSSQLPRRAFQHDGHSWRCEQTALLAVDIVKQWAAKQRSVRRAGSDAASIGFITPDVAQAQLVWWHLSQLQHQGGPAVACGTIDSFEPVAVDTLIFDLMQDDQPRWLSQADLSSDVSGRSAAKMLNVGLTKATSVIHLLGDWEFIAHSPSPGMRALAQLRWQPGFELIQQPPKSTKNHRQPTTINNQLRP